MHACLRAGLAGTDRIGALRTACQLYTEPLGDGEDYEWIIRHRVGVLHLALDVHTALAAAIADTDRSEAARVLHRATDLDPVNEEVCRQAMRAYHRLGDLDTIRSLHRRLALSLDEIGAEPAPETTDLVEQLRRDRQPHHRTSPT